MAFHRYDWIPLKMLYSPVLESFTDSKLLDFARASNSMTLHINRTLCVACYNTVCMSSY